VGDYRTAGSQWEVLSVLAKDEALIVMSAGYGEDSGFVFHVKGWDTKNTADGSKFGTQGKRGWVSRELIFVGIYKYAAASRAAKTVHSYIIYKPLTREQFADALRQAFRLVSYRLTVTREPNYVDPQGGNYTQLEDTVVKKIVSRPVE
jgi:hypothetical protein